MTQRSNKAYLSAEPNTKRCSQILYVCDENWLNYLIISNFKTETINYKVTKLLGPSDILGQAEKLILHFLRSSPHLLPSCPNPIEFASEERLGINIHRRATPLSPPPSYVIARLCFFPGNITIPFIQFMNTIGSYSIVARHGHYRLLRVMSLLDCCLHCIFFQATLLSIYQLYTSYTIAYTIITWHQHCCFFRVMLLRNSCLFCLLSEIDYHYHLYHLYRLLYAATAFLSRHCRLFLELCHCSSFAQLLPLCLLP